MSNLIFDIILHTPSADGAYGAHLLSSRRGRGAVFSSNIQTPPNVNGKVVAFLGFCYTPDKLKELAVTADRIVVFAGLNDVQKQFENFETKNVELHLKEKTTCSELVLEYLSENEDNWILSMIKGTEEWASVVSVATAYLGYHVPEKISELLDKQYSDFILAGQVLAHQRTQLVETYGKTAVECRFNSERFKSLSDVRVAVVCPPVFLLNEVTDYIFDKLKVDCVLLYTYIFDTDVYEVRLFCKEANGVANLFARQLPEVTIQNSNFVDGKLFGSRATVPQRMEHLRGEALHSYVVKHSE